MCIHFTAHLHILCVALKPLLRSEEEKYLPVAWFLSESMFRNTMQEPANLLQWTGNCASTTCSYLSKSQSPCGQATNLVNGKSYIFTLYYDNHSRRKENTVLWSLFPRWSARDIESTTPFHLITKFAIILYNWRWSLAMQPEQDL